MITHCMLHLVVKRLCCDLYRPGVYKSIGFFPVQHVSKPFDLSDWFTFSTSARPENQCAEYWDCLEIAYCLSEQLDCFTKSQVKMCLFTLCLTPGYNCPTAQLINTMSCFCFLSFQQPPQPLNHHWQGSLFMWTFKSTPASADEQIHSPRRCLSTSDRLDMFASKEGMTELLFAPENVKGKGYTWQDLEKELQDSARLLSDSLRSANN